VGILTKSGDFLPVWRAKKVKTRTGKERTKYYRMAPQHKDGETPGEEWTKSEVLAIRALANPSIGTPEKAAPKCGLLPKNIKKLLRNPYFMNEIYKLTNSHLQQARSRVMGAVIRNATSGSYQDRQLYFRLTGDLKDEKRIEMRKRAEVLVGDATEAEVDDWIQEDIDALNEDVKRNRRRRNG
jgi:hypothetical protein